MTGLQANLSVFRQVCTITTIVADTNMFNISFRSLLRRDSLKSSLSLEISSSHRNVQSRTGVNELRKLPSQILGGVRQTGERRSVALPVKDAGRTISRAGLRDALDRIVLLSVLLFAYWATAWIFLVGFGGYYFNRTSYHPVGVNFWLFNTAIPILPGLGLLGALVGIVKRDRPISFLVAFLPNVLNFVIYASLPALGQGQIYSDFTEAAFGFVTLFGAGIGLGLFGLSGSYYGNWRENRQPRNARISLLLLILGFFVWGSIIWVWPGYSAAVPGLGLSF